MPVIEIVDIGDSRLDKFRDLKSARKTRRDSYFIAEGRLVVERLLESAFQVESVVVARRRLAEIAPIVPEWVDVYVVEQALCESLVGFQFHSGILCCGVRKPHVRTSLPIFESDLSPILFCVFPETTLDINLGSMIRTSAAFGVNGLIVGPKSADPFSRRSLRSSMGNVFQVPVFQPIDLFEELERLKLEQGFSLIAASQGPDSISLEKFKFPIRTLLVFGNEGKGLGEEWLSLCDTTLEIPLASGVDSLNVAAAASVVLYEHFRQYRIG